MNSLYNQLKQSSTSNPMNIINAIRRSNNPYQALINMSQNDNRIAQILQEVNSNGGDARSLFYAKAKQMGVNPDDILNQLR